METWNSGTQTTVETGLAEAATDSEVQSTHEGVIVIILTHYIKISLSLTTSVAE